jgi:hypothetical protein
MITERPTTNLQHPKKSQDPTFKGPASELVLGDLIFSGMWMLTFRIFSQLGIFS